MWWHRETSLQSSARDVSANLVTSPVHAQSPNWTKARESVLLRDNHQCVECGVRCGRAEADVHHLLPRSAGGTDEPSNLVTLCDGCHAAHHPKLAGRLARRVMERCAVKLALWLESSPRALEFESRPGRHHQQQMDRSFGSLRRSDMSGVGGEADMPRTLLDRRD